MQVSVSSAPFRWFSKMANLKISKIAIGWDACFLLGPVMWLHGRSAIFTLFYAVRTSTLLARLTPSITPAGPAPTRSWDGQTIQNSFSEAFFFRIYIFWIFSLSRFVLLFTFQLWDVLKTNFKMSKVTILIRMFELGLTIYTIWSCVPKVTFLLFLPSHSWSHWGFI